MDKLNNFKIIVPIFNEFENLKDFIYILIKNNQDISKFFFVDNGSTDKKIKELLSNYNLHHISSEENLDLEVELSLNK